MSVARFAALLLLAVGLTGPLDGASAQTRLAQAAPTPKPGDAFGEEVTLPARTIVFSKGSANWDSAFETLVEAFKNVQSALQKQGIKPAGPPMTIYTATDDTGFEYQAGVPVAEEPKGPLGEGLAVEKSPDGHALQFIIGAGRHNGLDLRGDHQPSRQNGSRHATCSSVHLTDPLTTPEDNLVIKVYVPIKIRRSIIPDAAQPRAGTRELRRRRAPRSPTLTGFSNRNCPD